MTEAQLQLERYYSCKPADFTVLDSLTLSQGLDSSGVMKQFLSVALLRSSDNTTLSLTFIGVSKLEIKQPALSQISFWIEILDGADLPMVESNFLVRDPEQERVVFFECDDFEIVIQE